MQLWLSRSLPLQRARRGRPHPFFFFNPAAVVVLSKFIHQQLHRVKQHLHIHAQQHLPALISHVYTTPRGRGVQIYKLFQNIINTTHLLLKRKIWSRIFHVDKNSENMQKHFVLKNLVC